LQGVFLWYKIIKTKGGAMKKLILILAVISLSGCAEKESQEPTVVEYMTGAAQLDAYKKTKVKIEDIDSKRRETYQEIQ
jgi:uncharacterized lipoprotein YajG